MNGDTIEIVLGQTFRNELFFFTIRRLSFQGAQTDRKDYPISATQTHLIISVLLGVFVCDVTRDDRSFAQRFVTNNLDE